MTARRPVHFEYLVLVLSLVGACALEAQDTRADGTFERTLRVDGPVDLDINTGSGDVQVRTGPGGEVRVVGRVRAHWSWRDGESGEERVGRVTSDPPITQTGSRIEVGRVEYRDHEWDGISVSYDVTVPVDTRVRSRSGSGDQALDGIGGPVESRAGSGDIRIGETGAEVRVSTGSGDIDLERAGGPLVARAGSGSVRARAVAGAIEVRTGSGRVEVTQTKPGDVDVTTGSGDIRIDGAQGALRIRAGSGDVTVDGRPIRAWELRTGSGDVTVRVADDVGFEIDARSGSGRVSSALDVERRRDEDDWGRRRNRELRGEWRGGGPRLGITTGSGSIRIE